MFAHEWSKTQVLVEPDVQRKREELAACVRGLLEGQIIEVPEIPGRDVQIVAIRELPEKKGLSTAEGQARLLHDLASIELQAMELGVRTLAEFSQAPQKFREELAEVTLDEGRHLGLCLKALEALGFPWGSFPTHIGLWQSVSAEDSLLDRILIVHRYLEGSGLDATSKILRRLSGVKAKEAIEAIAIISHDEMSHVQFGSRWYHQLVEAEGLHPEQDFSERLAKLFSRIPRRLEPINHDLRTQAGFSAGEIQHLEDLRLKWLAGGYDRIHPPGG